MLGPQPREVGPHDQQRAVLAREHPRGGVGQPPGDPVPVLGKHRRRSPRRARAARGRRRAGHGRRGRRSERPRAAQFAAWAISDDCSATQPSWPSTGSSARRTSPRRGARAMISTAGSASLILARTGRRFRRRRAPADSRRPTARSSTSANDLPRWPHQLDQLGDRRRIPGHDLVGVVGDEADQPERQLELAAQHRLGSRRLADRDDAAGGKLRDLGRRVEARPVDVPVHAAVARRVSGLRRRPSSSAWRTSAENGPPCRIQWPRTGVARLHEERAQRPIGQAVGREVQIVEHDQRPELERRVDRAAGGAARSPRLRRAASAPRCWPGGVT